MKKKSLLHLRSARKLFLGAVIALSGMLTGLETKAQVTFPVNENFGNPSNSITSVDVYNVTPYEDGFFNSAASSSPNAFNFTGTVDVRKSYTSDSYYNQASGQGNIFFNSGASKYLQIENISFPSNAVNISLSFGLFKSKTGAYDGSFKVEYSESVSGSNFVTMTMPDLSAWTATGWYKNASTSEKIRMATTLPATTKRIRFTNTSTSVQYRMDDISMKANDCGTLVLDGITFNNNTNDALFCPSTNPTLNCNIPANCNWLWSSTTTTLNTSNTTGLLTGSNPSSSPSPTSITHLTASTTVATTYRIKVTSTLNGCVLTDDITLTPIQIAGGTVAINGSGNTASICTGGQVDLTVSGDNADGQTITYQWQQKVGSGSFSDINGATNANHSPTGITQTTTYRRVINTVKDGVACSANSAEATVTVNPVPTVNNVSDQSKCAGALSDAVTFSGTPTGVTYTWSNNNTAIGLGANGTGNIPAFTTTNSTNAAISGTITVRPNANGCQGSTKQFTITVKPKPGLSDPADQVLCAEANTATVTFGGSSVSGTTYSWTNNNTSIGLSQSSGSGTIASFVAKNPSQSSANVATISVLATANGCTSDPQSFTYTVNPTPTVDQPENQTVCNGKEVDSITFSGTPMAATFAWENSDNSIGLASTGTGNISSFTASNNGTTDKVATVTVRASANTCTSSPKSFTITVKPSGNTGFVNNQVLCNGEETDAVIFSSTVVGTTYAWTNDNTTIGLDASGTGDIPAFDAVNTGVAEEVATVTVISNTPLGCGGDTTSFTYTVKPTPTVDPVSNQTVCANDSTEAVVFSGASDSTSFDWEFNQVAVGQGTMVTGSDSIPAFEAKSTDRANRVSTVTITPRRKGCVGQPTSFTYTVRPIPAKGSGVQDKVICSGTLANVQLGSTVSGTTYTWTASGNTTVTGFNPCAMGCSDVINDSLALTNMATDSTQVIYTVTPTANTCSGTPFTVKVALNYVKAGTVTPANSTICSGLSQDLSVNGDAISTDATASYSWKESPTGEAAHNFAAAGTNNDTTYSTQNLTITTHFKRVLTSTLNGVGCSASTAFTAVNVQSPPNNHRLALHLTDSPDYDTINVDFTSCANDNEYELVVMKYDGVTYNPMPDNITDNDYIWTVGGEDFGASTSASLAEIGARRNGSKEVKVIVLDAVEGNCPDTLTTTQVFTNPILSSIEQVGAPKICPNGTGTATFKLNGVQVSSTDPVKVEYAVIDPNEPDVNILQEDATVSGTYTFDVPNITNGLAGTDIKIIRFYHASDPCFSDYGNEYPRKTTVATNAVNPPQLAIVTPAAHKYDVRFAAYDANAPIHHYLGINAAANNTNLVLRVNATPGANGGGAIASYAWTAVSADIANSTITTPTAANSTLNGLSGQARYNSLLTGSINPTELITYQVLVTDANGCTSTATTNVRVADIRCAAGAAPQVATCAGSGNTGSLSGSESCVSETVAINSLKQTGAGRQGTFLGHCDVKSAGGPINPPVIIPGLLKEGISDAEANEAGVNMGLVAFPNPFSEELNIRFFVANDNTEVRVYITDLLGRTVYAYAPAMYTEGVQSLIWTGTDRQGNKAPQGMYLVQIHQNGEVKTVRVSLNN